MNIFVSVCPVCQTYTEFKQGDKIVDLCCCLSCVVMQDYNHRIREQLKLTPGNYLGRGYGPEDRDSYYPGRY